LTVHGWVPLHDLQVGQSIAVPSAVPAFGTDESWSLDMVRLLAYFIAEGGLTNRSPMFTNTDSVIVEDFKRIIATYFPSCAIRQERITFSVASPQLAADLHHAFVRFGIRAKYYKTSQNAWRVEVTNPNSVKRYQEEIGWIGEKNERFSEYTHIVSSRIGNLGHAPQETWQIVRAGAQSQGITLVELARRSGETTKQGKYSGYNSHAKRGIPRYRLAGYAEVLNDVSLR